MGTKSLLLACMSYVCDVTFESDVSVGIFPFQCHLWKYSFTSDKIKFFGFPFYGIPWNTLNG